MYGVVGFGVIGFSSLPPVEFSPDLPMAGTRMGMGRCFGSPWVLFGSLSAGSILLLQHDTNYIGLQACTGGLMAVSAIPFLLARVAKKGFAAIKA